MSCGNKLLLSLTVMLPDWAPDERGYGLNVMGLK